MPVELTRSDIEQVASLADLELADDEIALYAKQLQAILVYAEEIQQVDTTGVPPTSHVLAGHAADRADEVRPSLDRRTALANAPDAAIEAGLFKVPRVIG
jgi:aspartyl-tRNA(Asn)/glutamyl-tRNA(Gln) amidotransferase subunit C